MPKQPIVIGISGMSGAGKTHFLIELKKEFGHRISAISLDDYYKPFHTQIEDANGFKNFDLPEAIDSELFLQHLNNLLLGISVVHRKYPFEKLDEPVHLNTILPAEIIVVEGLFVFSYPNIVNCLHYKIFMETEIDLCCSRRLKRDELERGISKDKSLYQWHNHVLPSYYNFIEPQKGKCDLILNGDTEVHLNLHILKTFLQINSG